ncbi:hypothetical protein HY3_06505 [Hyphomonas pacifica]|uniref:diguanylate cyclase n=2 Tax=Hyphomonas pacifica TaxID=1280941 RepID=A0A062TYF3_9PROT|nr:hypothetical protein HY2_05530 [Hyphomonas pacifica]RAN30461.1 hypothetical protein HY3_06505 [Hyphomonas pacifica]RAN31848.1 hypothetical protein HY11_06600 [Hyphomonas pacifica]
MAGVMRLSTITNTAYVTTVALSMIAGVAMLMASNSMRTERAAVQQRYVLDKATSGLDHEIFYQSEKAREYVISGNPEYLEDFKAGVINLNDTRAMLGRVEDAGARKEELSTLQTAIDMARTLVNNQQNAIEAYQAGDVETARKMVFSDHYEGELSLIDATITRFQALLDQRTQVEVEHAITRARFWRFMSEVVLAATALMFLCVLYFILKRRILRPVMRLSDVVTRLAAEDYSVEISDFRHMDEIGDMAEAVKIFRENGLERLRLEEKLERDLKLRNLLSRMTHRMQACESKKEVANVVRLFLPVILPGYAGKMYLFEEDDQMMRQACDWLEPKGSAPEFPPGECWSIRRGAPHRQGGNQTDMPCQHMFEPGQLDHVEAFDIATLCVPLTAQREVIGLLYCELPDGVISIEQEHYVFMMAENISLSLANMHLREELHEQATADPLTGLSNRRLMEQRLNTLLYDAHDTGRPVSCIMLDIDNFKMLNDTYGHDMGDQVLKDVAGVLKSHTREDGLAFRYGGEEFVILLPGVEPGDAVRRAEAIRKGVAALHFTFNEAPIKKVTASFGVATTPNHCAGNKLITTADAALYESKEKGRDRVTKAPLGVKEDLVA